MSKSKSDERLNNAIWAINSKKTKCDKCKRHKKCYHEGRLMTFTVSDDYAKVSDYDNNGAHAMLRIDKKCPKQEEKDERK